MTRPIVVALGDSLTLGEHADAGVDLHNHPWPALLDANLYPEAGVANYGKGGNTVQEMHDRYTDWVKDLTNVDVVILWGPINNVVQDQSAATIEAALDSLINEILADGRTVILVGTCGFHGYTDWTAPRQAVLDAVLTWMAARTGVTYVSAYAAFPVGLSTDVAPVAIYPTLAISDNLHINPTGTLQAADVMLLPYLRAIYPVVQEVEATNVTPGTPYLVKRGDLRPSIRMTLTGRDGEPLALPDGSTVRFRMRTVERTTPAASPKVDALAVIEDAATATVRYDWAGTDTDTNGSFYGEFRRVLASGQETVPADSYLEIRVINPA